MFYFNKPSINSEMETFVESKIKYLAFYIVETWQEPKVKAREHQKTDFP